jgi:hypothetical protein
MKPRAQRSDFLVKTVGDQVVLFDQSRRRLHVLSRTAALVWRHCDGQHTVAELRDLLGCELGAPVDESLITLALAQLDEAQLLEGRLAPASGEDKVSRRDLLHMAGALAAGIMMPMITSCGAPTEPRAAAAARPFLTLDNTTTTSTTATTPLFTTTTSTTPAFTTTTSTTPLFTTTTSTTPVFTTTTSTTPVFTTTTSTTSTTTTSTTTTTTTPAPKKVAMCHNGRTIMVDQDAVEAHLAHGDTLGRCQ